MGHFRASDESCSKREQGPTQPIRDLRLLQRKPNIFHSQPAKAEKTNPLRPLTASEKKKDKQFQQHSAVHTTLNSRLGILRPPGTAAPVKILGPRFSQDKAPPHRPSHQIGDKTHVKMSNQAITAYPGEIFIIFELEFKFNLIPVSVYKMIKHVLKGIQIKD